MNLTFENPWLVLGAAALGLCVPVLAWRVRRVAPVLMLLAGAMLLLAGSGPRLGGAGREVVHLAVLDVSDSMTPRLASVREQLKRELESVALPPGHRVEFLQVSDALREEGAPTGGPTQFSRLADARVHDGFNGEVVLITDGRGEFGVPGLEPPRVIVLRAESPGAPDGAVAGVRGPAVLAKGSAGILSAELFCDSEVVARWRVFRGDTEVASGTRNLRAGVPAGVSASFVADQPGLLRFRVRIDVPGDRDTRNDEAAFSVLVAGGRIVEYACDPAVPLAMDGLHAMIAADARNEVRVRHSMPATPAELEGIGLLVINNLPLWKSGLEAEGLESIAAWVRGGGSLLLAGADAAFAPGGYRGTAIEAVSPVRFRPDDEPPRRALLLLDTSASMSGARLAGLKAAARRFVAGLHSSDSAAVAGFSSRLARLPEFSSAGNRNAHEAAIEALTADGRTHIRTSLRQGVELLAGTGQDRILLITDGEDGDTRDDAAWRELGSRIAELKLRVDFVMTDANWRTQGGYDWFDLLRTAPGAPDVHQTTVGARGFDELLTRLDEAMAAAERALVLHRDMEVGGVNVRLPLVVRTAMQRTDKVTPILMAQTPRTRRPEYPLLAYRELIGRSAAICTESAGSQALVDFWLDPLWRERVEMILNLLLENAGRPNLALNPLAEGAELVWIGPGEPPGTDLRLSPGGSARQAGSGRWLLGTLPDAPEIQVFDGARILQRIALPKLVPAELARTGNDEVSLSMAEQAGYRVVSTLAAWLPRRWSTADQAKVGLEWLAAALASGLLIAGFALRRRRMTV